MNDAPVRIGRQFRTGTTALLALSAAVAGLAGCSRELCIRQADYINTAVHMDRPTEARTGDPLEVNVVCVTPKDLEHTTNSRLAPDAGITADVWFANRPQPGDTLESAEREGRFFLPRDQILLYTYNDKTFGRRLGNSLRGAAVDGRREFTTPLDFPSGMSDKRSAVYVFGKFIGPDGQVLAVPPAKFSPPGAYSRELVVEISVKDGQANYGQYIGNVTSRD